MKNKLRPINVMVTVLGVLALGMLAVWSTACHPPTPTVPPIVSTTTRPAATPSPTAIPGRTRTLLPPTPTQTLLYIPLGPTATKSTPGATVTPRPGTPVPTPTMTQKEQALVAEQQHANAQSASSFAQCPTIMATEFACNVINYSTRITRPEWKALFPRAEFFLIKYDRASKGWRVPQQNSVLVIEQDGQRYYDYDDRTFERLLTTNHVVITSTNRELVAKAFVLIALPDYLEEEIVFSDWKQGSWPSRIALPYNYMLIEWTKIQGLKIGWWFIFDEGLYNARGAVMEFNIGNYIDVPFERLPLPSPERLEYWRRP